MERLFSNKSMNLIMVCLLVLHLSFEKDIYINKNGSGAKWISCQDGTKDNIDIVDNYSGSLSVDNHKLPVTVRVSDDLNPTNFRFNDGFLEIYGCFTFDCHLQASSAYNHVEASHIVGNCFRIVI